MGRKLFYSICFSSLKFETITGKNYQGRSLLSFGDFLLLSPSCCPLRSTPCVTRDTHAEKGGFWAGFVEYKDACHSMGLVSFVPTCEVSKCSPTDTWSLGVLEETRESENLVSRLGSDLHLPSHFEHVTFCIRVSFAASCHLDGLSQSSRDYILLGGFLNVKKNPLSAPVHQIIGKIYSFSWGIFFTLG